MTPPKDRRRTLRSLYVWHRWIGVVCALLVVWLAITGILLNHGSRLGLDRTYVRSPWLLRAYGITPTAPAQGYRVGDHWVAHAGEQLFLDARPVAELPGALIGVAVLPEVILAASPDHAVLLTREGERIETLGRDVLPGRLLAVAATNHHLLLRTADGVYASDAALTAFKRYDDAWPLQASRAQPLPADIARGITAAGAGIRLSRERVLADLHSGRLFGRYGPWIMDVASVGFMLLALTGLWLWWRYRRSQRLRMHPD